MGTQISLKLSDRMFKAAKEYAESQGYHTLQDFIREAIRQRLFGEEQLSGRFTALASEKALARRWLTKEEDEAWAHLQSRI